jgi:hypothetical protein
MELDGYGYEWDANLIGGPADGCVDRVIQVKPQCTNPPVYFKKMLDVYPKRESLGEKLIEAWADSHLNPEIKVAVYKLQNDVDPEDDICDYHYLETMTVQQFRDKYETIKHL